MFVSSEMPEVMGIADRIIVMCDGRITGEVSAREATQDEILTMATSFENKSIKETEGGSKMNSKQQRPLKKLLGIRGMGAALTAFVGLIIIYIAFGIINPAVFQDRIC